MKSFGNKNLLLHAIFNFCTTKLLEKTVTYQIDVSLKSSPNHNIDLRLLHHQVCYSSAKHACKRWNFRKAKWSHYIALTNRFAKTLLPPDSLDVDAAYQEYCYTIKKAAKKTIPRGYRNNYISCWDAEYESLYRTFLQSPQGDDSSLAATALLAKLDRKRRDRWSEAVRNIDFSHSSRKAWRILNNLTGRSRHSPRHCPVLADAIASQLVRNWKYEVVDRKSSRLVSQEVSDFGGPQHQTQ